jgi:hypothetical protein
MSSNQVEISFMLLKLKEMDKEIGGNASSTIIIIKKK